MKPSKPFPLLNTALLVQKRILQQFIIDDLLHYSTISKNTLRSIRNWKIKKIKLSLCEYKTDEKPVSTKENFAINLYVWHKNKDTDIAYYKKMVVDEDLEKLLEVLKMGENYETKKRIVEHLKQTFQQITCTLDFPENQIDAPKSIVNNCNIPIVAVTTESDKGSEYLERFFDEFKSCEELDLDCETEDSYRYIPPTPLKCKSVALTNTKCIDSKTLIQHFGHCEEVWLMDTAYGLMDFKRIIEVFLKGEVNWRHVALGAITHNGSFFDCIQRMLNTLTDYYVMKPLGENKFEYSTYPYTSQVLVKRDGQPDLMISRCDRFPRFFFYTDFVIDDRSLCNMNSAKVDKRKKN